MNIEILADDMPLSGAEETYIRRRLGATLGGRRSAIDTVQAWVCDIPGFDSEAVIHCRVDVKLINGQTVIGDSCDCDFETVVQRAAARVGQILANGSGGLSRPWAPIPPQHLGANRRPVASYLENSL